MLGWDGVCGSGTERISPCIWTRPHGDDLQYCETQVSVCRSSTPGHSSASQYNGITEK